jgi:APA family basic amino acid/polyamine antiporter
MAMVAYTGIESIAQLGAESKRPAKTVPRAIILTMIILLLMYVGISLVALSAISPKDLGTKYLEDPLAGVVQALPFGSQVLSPWIGLLAALLLFVASNAGLVGASRLAYNLGDYYQLPAVLTRLNPKFRTPVISLSIFTVLSSVIVIMSRGEMSFLADLYNFGAMIAFFSAHMSLIVLRIRRPDIARPFKIPLNIPFGKFSLPITAIIGAISTFSVFCLVLFTKPAGRTLGVFWLICGLTIYFLYRKKRKIGSTASVSIERIKVPEYEKLKVTNILVPTKGDDETDTVQIACELARFHHAKITAAHIIEVPPSLPLDAALKQKKEAASITLKRAEAIAREIGVDIDLKILYGRNIVDSVLDEVHSGKFDLLVIGTLHAKRVEFKHHGIGFLTEEILKKCPCRVWVCSYSGKRKK